MSAAATNAKASSSAAPAAAKAKESGSSSAKSLAGLVPYLKPYKGAIALGFLVLALTSLIGTVIPLTTGVITDVLAGDAQPFQHGGQNQALSNSSLGRAIPYYVPHSRRSLEIYCLLLAFLLHALDSDRHLSRHRIRHAPRSSRSPAGDGARILRSQSHR
jgi:hypothetical protein